jgi:hypothetical protein
MAMVGITMMKWELTMPVWWSLAPLTTTPSARRSTTRRKRSGSACSVGRLERSPLGSVMQPEWTRSSVWIMVWYRRKRS